MLYVVADNGFAISVPASEQAPAPVAELVQGAMDEGLLARDDVWEVVMCLWAHSHGLIALYRAERFSYDAAAFRHFHDASLRRLIDGLKA